MCLVIGDAGVGWTAWIEGLMDWLPVGYVFFFSGVWSSWIEVLAAYVFGSVFDFVSWVCTFNLSMWSINVAIYFSFALSSNFRFSFNSLWSSCFFKRAS